MSNYPEFVIIPLDNSEIPSIVGMYKFTGIPQVYLVF